MRIAINGAGIAGPTLAWWLHRAGHEAILIEQAPQFRVGGYVIDFWGLGYDLADRMGVLEQVRAQGYQVEEVRFVGANGKRTSGFGADVFRRMTGDRFTSLPRGDLAAAIFAAIEGKVETIFGDSIVAIEERPDGVGLTLASGATCDADLVIGADGQHSRVRELILGPEQQFERDIGFHVAASNAPDYVPRDPDIYVTRSWPGRSLSRFALRDGSTLFLFVLAAEHWHGPMPNDDGERKAGLRRVFGGLDWETPAILDAMDSAGAIYFDRVSQIELPRWSSGRAALVGDAAACVSLLAGEGTGLAMVAAYVLAGEITRAGSDYPTAFAEYERKLRGFLTTKQASARAFASSFAPKTRTGIVIRDVAMQLMRIPWLADRMMGNSVKDDFELPDYPELG